MAVAVQPPSDPTGCSAIRDDEESVLRAFFRAEMPQPWPSFSPPSADARSPLVIASTRRPWSARSHLALAASVGLLLVGSLALSNILKPGAPDASIETLGPGARMKRPIDEPKSPLLPSVPKKR